MFIRSALLTVVLLLLQSVACAQRASQEFEPEDGLFIELTETLATLVHAAPEDRAKIETMLTQQAQRLINRLR